LSGSNVVCFSDIPTQRQKECLRAHIPDWLIRASSSRIWDSSCACIANPQGQDPASRMRIGARLTRFVNGAISFFNSDFGYAASDRDREMPARAKLHLMVWIDAI
jgi:hypothetical protein